MNKVVVGGTSLAHLLTPIGSSDPKELKIIGGAINVGKSMLMSSLNGEEQSPIDSSIQNCTRFLKAVDDLRSKR